MRQLLHRCGSTASRPTNSHSVALKLQDAGDEFVFWLDHAFRSAVAWQIASCLPKNVPKISQKKALLFREVGI